MKIVLTIYLPIADDVSMLIATSCVLRQAMNFRRTNEYARNCDIILLLTVIPTIIYHAVTDERVVHELVFAFMVTVVGKKTSDLVHGNLRTEQQKGRVMRLVWLGAAAFVFGYILWQLDHILCIQLTAIKRSLGVPWGFLFELHGWWHIMTAIGAYTFMAIVEWLTVEEPDPDGCFAWPVSLYLSARPHEE